MVKKAGEGKGVEFTLDAGAFEALRDSVTTFAPDLVGVGPARKITPRREETSRDTYARGATPKQPHEDEVSVSSVQPRERKGTGFSMHELRAKQVEDPESVLPTGDEIPSEYCHKVEYGDSVPSEHPLPEDYAIEDLLENPLDESYLDQVDVNTKAGGFNNIADMLYEDAILDAYRNNMAATFEANETRGFSNELHLWDERYVYDAHLRMDTDEAAERMRNLESDRMAAEARRRAEDDANRARMDADAARRRYEDDLNRR